MLRKYLRMSDNFSTFVAVNQTYKDVKFATYHRTEKGIAGA